MPAQLQLKFTCFHYKRRTATHFDLDIEAPLSAEETDQLINLAAKRYEDMGAYKWDLGARLDTGPLENRWGAMGNISLSSERFEYLQQLQSLLNKINAVAEKSGDRDLCALVKEGQLNMRSDLGPKWIAHGPLPVNRVFDALLEWLDQEDRQSNTAGVDAETERIEDWVDLEVARHEARGENERSTTTGATRGGTRPGLEGS